MRDDFPAAVRDVLAKRVCFHCSNPDCKTPTSGPQEDPAKVVNVGVAAHITAASPDGPRYSQALTQEQRKAPENGIWLCQRCAKLVDNDSARYTVEKLLAWKADAELLAIRALEVGAGGTYLQRITPIGTPYSKLEQMMPELLAEMKKDVSEQPLCRELIVLSSHGNVYNGDSVFVYYKCDHPSLHSKLRILQNHGLIQEITYNNVGSARRRSSSQRRPLSRRPPMWTIERIRLAQPGPAIPPAPGSLFPTRALSRNDVGSPILPSPCQGSAPTITLTRVADI